MGDSGRVGPTCIRVPGPSGSMGLSFIQPSASMHILSYPALGWAKRESHPSLQDQLMASWWRKTGSFAPWVRTRRPPKEKSSLEPTEQLLLWAQDSYLQVQLGPPHRAAHPLPGPVCHGPRLSALRVWAGLAEIRPSLSEPCQPSAPPPPGIPARPSRLLPPPFYK